MASPIFIFREVHWRFSGIPNFKNAKCKGLGGMWDTDAPTHHKQEAVKLCKQCDHMLECSEWAVTHHETGVWGGRYFRHPGRE